MLKDHGKAFCDNHRIRHSELPRYACTLSSAALTAAKGLFVY